jgi:hypothetical protein
MNGYSHEAKTDGVHNPNYFQMLLVDLNGVGVGKEETLKLICLWVFVGLRCKSLSLLISIEIC